MKPIFAAMGIEIKPGEYHNLKVARAVDFGLYLDDGEKGLLLPKRFAPAGAAPGDTLQVFVYHDSEDRLIATTQKPLGKLGEIVYLRAVQVTAPGAFLDWGLMKDLFVPKSQQLSPMRVNGMYLVKIYLDEKTGRVAATERVEQELSNENAKLELLQTVDLTVLRRTDIGYLVIINNKHTGVLHFNEIYRPIQAGDRFRGYIKNLLPDNKIDVAAGEPGYKRVESETDKIMRLLKEINGYLNYHDKSDPEDIYLTFSMSKKTFKMALGSLYRQKLISLEPGGIRMQ